MTGNQKLNLEKIRKYVVIFFYEKVLSVNYYHEVIIEISHLKKKMESQ